MEKETTKIGFYHRALLISNVEDFPHINNLFPDASWRDPTV
jgi:hypothetical protein